MRQAEPQCVHMSLFPSVVWARRCSPQMAYLELSVSLAPTKQHFTLILNRAFPQKSINVPFHKQKPGSSEKRFCSRLHDWVHALNRVYPEVSFQGRVMKDEPSVSEIPHPAPTLQLKTHWFGIRIGRNADEGHYPELTRFLFPECLNTILVKHDTDA